MSCLLLLGLTEVGRGHFNGLLLLWAQTEAERAVFYICFSLAHGQHRRAHLLH